MNRDAQDNLTLLLGATLLVVGISDLHLRYVKPAMQPLLVLSGVVLLAFGARGVVSVLRELVGRAPAVAEGHADADDGHGHGPTRTAWLLVLPLLVLSLVAPPSLGAFAAARSETSVPRPTFALPPLPAATGGAVDLTLTDYYSRVLYDPDSLQGATLRLSGFVTPVDGRWFVTRMALACCAADGRPIKVLTAGAPAQDVPDSDAWVEVLGTYTRPQSPAEGEKAVPVLELMSVRPIATPRQQYE